MISFIQNAANEESCSIDTIVRRAFVVCVIAGPAVNIFVDSIIDWLVVLFTSSELAATWLNHSPTLGLTSRVGWCD